MAIGLNDINNKPKQKEFNQTVKSLRPWQTAEQKDLNTEEIQNENFEASQSLNKMNYFDMKVEHIVKKNEALLQEFSMDKKLEEYRNFLTSASREKHDPNELEKHLVYRSKKGGGVTKFIQNLFS
ncbi:MAG: hypothetical protein H6622_16455 [Halobacteriovoraceae bacterium]|nr:hypothetical protein [Halobacteriovoraceae bacterium]